MNDPKGGVPHFLRVVRALANVRASLPFAALVTTVVAGAHCGANSGSVVVPCNGFCVMTCTSDTDCGTGDYCASDGNCTPNGNCLTDADCKGAGMVCTNGACMVADTCATDADCGGAPCAVCGGSEGTCVFSCGACTAQADCTDGATCDTTRGECVGGTIGGTGGSGTGGNAAGHGGAGGS